MNSAVVTLGAGLVLILWDPASAPTDTHTKNLCNWLPVIFLISAPRSFAGSHLSSIKVFRGSVHLPTSKLSRGFCNEEYHIILKDQLDSIVRIFMEMPWCLSLDTLLSLTGLCYHELSEPTRGLSRKRRLLPSLIT